MMICDGEYVDNGDDDHHEGTLAVVDVEAEVGAHAWFRVDHLQNDQNCHCHRQFHHH